METDNSYRGGVLIKLWSQSYKIVQTNLTGMWLRLKKLDAGPRPLSLYKLDSSDFSSSSLPQPGLYVTEYGSYDDSEGLIAVQYNKTVLALQTITILNYPEVRVSVWRAPS